MYSKKTVVSQRVALVLPFILSMAFGLAGASAQERTLVTGVDANTLIHSVLDPVLGQDITVHLLHSIIIDPNQPSHSHTGVVLDMSRSPKGIDQMGLGFRIARNKKTVAHIQIGVYASTELADKVFNETIVHKAMPPSQDLGGECGNIAFGWINASQDSTSGILLLRDNVVVAINMRVDLLIPEGVASDVVLTTAKAIDKALVEGAGSVRRGPALQMPRIIKVDVPESVLPGIVDLKVHVAIPQAVYGVGSRGFDRLAAQAERNPLLLNENEIEIVRVLRCSVPHIKVEIADLNYLVRYFTSDCVVTSKQVTLRALRKQ